MHIGRGKAMIGTGPTRFKLMFLLYVRRDELWHDQDVAVLVGTLRTRKALPLVCGRSSVELDGCRVERGEEVASEVSTGHRWLRQATELIGCGWLVRGQNCSELRRHVN